MSRRPSHLHSTNPACRTLLYLQLVVQMQQQFSSDDSLGILKKPEHILSFIKQVLAPRQSDSSHTRTEQVGGLRMEDLRIVPQESEGELEDGDSGDEGEGAEGATERPGHDMKSTAVKLLLSVLEGTLSAFQLSVHTSTRHRKRIRTYLHATRPRLTTYFRSSNHSPRRRKKKSAP